MVLIKNNKIKKSPLAVFALILLIVLCWIAVTFILAERLANLTSVAPKTNYAASPNCTHTVTLVFPSITPTISPTPTPTLTPTPTPTQGPSPTPKTPTPTCRPRPACLYTKPFCYIPEPVEGWCPTGTPTKAR